MSLQNYSTFFRYLENCRLECIDFDIYELIKKDSKDLGIVSALISSQAETLARFKLGIDSNFDERFTFPLIGMIPVIAPNLRSLSLRYNRMSESIIKSEIFI